MLAANNPALHSWIDIAATSHFPIQNLPFGVFETPERGPRVGMAIGDYILDLYALSQRGFFDDLDLGPHEPKMFRRRSLNRFIAQGRPAWRAVRQRASELLRHDNPALRDDETMNACLVRQRDAQMLRPVKPGNYTDFYSSLEHAANVGRLFRDPANPLPPNWRHLPIGYHGRASSIVVSGTTVQRPNGQRKVPEAVAPTFGPSQQLDFELEMAFITGRATALGHPIPIQHAEEAIFGLVLFNDWSARDIQSWETTPLGPFLGKSFASSISPWVVTLDALEPFRVSGPVQEPEPLLYLRTVDPHHFDINLEVKLQSSDGPSSVIARSNFRHLYWSMAQQLAHQTSNGCNLQVGDLYASGTISGPSPDSCGSLLELTLRGTQPLSLPDGTQRGFLLDGDTVTMCGYAEQDGLRIGFGEVAGTVLGAL